MRALPQLKQEVFAEPKRQLTDKQQRFVDAFVQTGGQRTQAAELAGYASRSAAANVSRMLHNPLIQSAIVKETLTAIGLSAVPALKVVTELMQHARSDYVKLEAARDLLDRAGFLAPDRRAQGSDQNLTVTLNLGTEGALKTAVTEIVTQPHTGKSPPEFDAPDDFPWEGAGEA